MNKNRQLAINITAQTISFAINLGVSFFLSPFIVKFIGSEAYGFVGLANDFISYAQLFTVALNSMAGRFITISLHQDKYEDLNQYYSSVIICNVLISVVMVIPAVFLLLMASKIINIPSLLVKDVTVLWAILFVNFILNLIGGVFSIAIFAKNRLELSSLRNIESSILRAIILVISFYWFKPSVWFVGLASVICTLYITGINIYYTKRLLPDIKISKNYFSFEKIKTLFQSGIWNSVNQLSSILSNGLNLLITNKLINSTAMGSLAIAKTVPIMILSAFGMLAGSFLPQLTISYAKNDFDSMKKDLISSMKILGVFACIPMSILIAYGDIFYGLWMPSQNAKLLQTLSVLISIEFVFALPLESLWNIFTTTNRVKQSSLFLLANSLVSVLTVIILLHYVNDTNIKLYIIAGTTTAFSIIRSLTFLPMFGAYCLSLKLNTFYPAIIKNTIAVLIVTLISFVIKQLIHGRSWTSLIFMAIVTTFISLALNVMIVLGKDERLALIDKSYKRFRNLLLEMKIHFNNT